MWVLETHEIPEGEEPRRYLLTPGSYAVGRLGEESQIFCDGRSISRNHATITVLEGRQGQDDVPEVSIEDSSRYGTYVNGERIKKGETKLLSAIPQPISLQFGYNHKFRLQQDGSCLCADSLADPSLKQKALSLGLKWSDSFSPDCTHVLVPACVHLSVLIALALIQEKHIVTDTWLDVWQQRTNSHDPAPEEIAFQPEIQAPGAAGVMTQHQLAALRGARTTSLLSSRPELHFTVPDELQDAELLRALITAVGGSLAPSRHGSEEVLVVEGGLEQSAGKKLCTTATRIRAALVQQSWDGMLVESRIGQSKRKAEPASPVADSHTKKRAKPGKVLTIRPDEDTDAEDEGENPGVVEDSDASDAEMEGPGDGSQKWFVKRKRGGDFGAQEGASNVVQVPLATLAAEGAPKRSKRGPRADSVPNFKAFRRKAKGVSEERKVLRCVKAMVRETDVDVADFLNAEKAQHAREKVADDLFGANMKPRKPLAKPANRGRGRGRGR